MFPLGFLVNQPLSLTIWKNPLADWSVKNQPVGRSLPVAAR
jgi:hypothetical protein